MLRRKHRTTANLKQDEDRNISRYLDSFLSQIRHPVNRIIRRNDIGNDEVTKEESTSGSSNKGTTRPEKIETQKKLRTIDNAVTIRLTNFDNPGPSRIQSNKTPQQTSLSKSKDTREKTTQMYQNLSTQRLKGNEDIDEDVSDTSLLEDEQRRPKYILVGWDSFRSKLMLILMILLILWAVIYFPLVGT